MPTLARFPVRLKYYTETRRTTDVYNASGAASVWRGNDVAISVGVFFEDSPLDLSNLASLKMQIKARRSPTSDPLSEVVVEAAAITPTITGTAWENGTAAHAVFNFTAAQMNLDLSGRESGDVWLVLSGLTTAGKTITYGALFCTVWEDNSGTSETPPTPTENYYTQDEIDAILAAGYQPLSTNLTAFAAKTAPTGAVVGTTDAQALMNKTMAAGSGNLVDASLLASGSVPVARLPAATTSAIGAVQLAGASVAVAGTSTSTVPTVDDAARLAVQLLPYQGGSRFKLLDRAQPRDMAKLFARWLSETPNGLNLALGLSVGDRRNLWQYTENLAHASYSVTNATKGSDTIVVDGITLTKLSGTGFYAYLTSNISGLGLTPFTTGDYYLFSCFVWSARDHEMWPSISPTLDASNHFRRKLTVPGKVRRIWQLARATANNAVDMGGVGTLAYGSGSGGGVFYWPVIGGYPDGSSAEANATLIYVGGFQIERVVSDGRNGIVGIGDSTMQGSAASIDSGNSLEWMAQLGAHLNVDAFNRGIGGNSTAAMDTRWATDITPLAGRCKYVIIQPSAANDIPNGVSLASTQASVQSMVAKAAADNLIPVLVVPPSTSSIAANTTYQATYDSLCTWLRQTYPLILDHAAILNDPFNRFQLRRQAGWEGDGTHWPSEAKRAVAEYDAGYPWWDFPRPSPYQPIATTAYTAPQFQLWDSATNSLKAVTLGAADSGGSGFKALRVAN